METPKDEGKRWMHCSYRPGKNVHLIFKDGLWKLSGCSHLEDFKTYPENPCPLKPKDKDDWKCPYVERDLFIPREAGVTAG